MPVTGYVTQYNVSADPSVRAGLCVAYTKDGALAVGVVENVNRYEGTMSIVQAQEMRLRRRGAGVRWAIAPSARNGGHRDVRGLAQKGDDGDGAWRLLDTEDADGEAPARRAWLQDVDWVAPGFRQLACSDAKSPG